MVRFVASLLLIAFPLVAVAAQGAEDRGKKRRRSYVVGEYAYKKLSEAHELLGEDRFDEAKSLIDELAKRKGLNPHEVALVWQTYGYIYSSKDQLARAADAFEKCLAQDALPDGAQLNTQYNLAQLYMATERFAEGVRTLKAWFQRAENPAASAYYLLALGYVQQDQVDQALGPAKTAVDLSPNPKEAWLQLLLSLRFEKKQYREVANLLEILVTRFPKKSYWMQLSAVYNELQQEENALAVMQVAYLQGFLTRDSELRNLAQMFLFHQIPYWGAKVLEQGLAQKQVDPDADAYELLANAWIFAREYDQALEPLQRAAKLSDDGDLYVRLAQVHMEREDWRLAVDALSAGLAKGSLRDAGHAQLLLGIANYNGKRVNAARQAFGRARRYEKVSQSARQWLKHIERERKLAQEL